MLYTQSLEWEWGRGGGGLEEGMAVSGISNANGNVARKSPAYCAVSGPLQWMELGCLLCSCGNRFVTIEHKGILTGPC